MTGISDGRRAAPLLSPGGTVLAFALALALSWPMLATGSFLVFSDTASYIRGGEIIWQMLLDITGLDTDPAKASGDGAAGVMGDAAGGPAMTNPQGQVYVLRSFVYSIYTFVAGATIWPAGFAILQAAMTLWMLFALIGPEALRRPWVLALSFVYLAAITPLPWFTVYLMPDMLAATVVLWGAILVGRIDVLARWQQVALTLIAAFAVAAHYGHGPLAAGLYGAVLLGRLVTRRLTWTVVAAAVFPVLFAPLANLGASTAALDTPSVTPLRLPILLARSIQDGPALWYLEEACPEAPLAFCEVFGEEMPANIRDFLWGPHGIESLTPDEMARIRAEEFPILGRAFLAYPVAQTVSLLGNAAKQAAMVGTAQITPAYRDEAGALVEPEDLRARRVLRLFDRIVPWGTWVGVALLAALALSGRLTRPQLKILAAVLLGLLLNAVIFGGLSAPVERYQSRVIWLLPALLGLFLAEGALGRSR